MFKRTKVCIGVLAAIGSGLAAVSLPSFAEEAQRIEITGSAIKQIDAETAVPVTVIKMEDLKSAGVTTVEQIMSSLTAVQIQTGSSQQVGSGSGGAAFADLRGVGNNKTLVLLNGRRIANNAIDGSAPDLNMIPFAALERVEVLRDGASSLYGTDAIGGVINFITRKDFRGGSLSVGIDVPKTKGGRDKKANVGFGYGDLSKDGFNVFGFLDVNHQQNIGGQQREFNNRQPGGLSPTPYPANYYQDGSVVGNPAAPACSDPSFLIPAGDGTSCYIATARFVDYTPKSERTSGMLRGTFHLGGNTNLTTEWFGTRNKTTTGIAPVPYGKLYQNPFQADGVTPNRYYPGNGTVSDATFVPNRAYTIADMTPTDAIQLQPGFLVVKWRALAGGNRTDISDNRQQRFLAQLDGTVGDWDYQSGLSYNENRVKQNIQGYTNGVKITAGVLNGVINPYGPQDAAGDAAVADAMTNGNLQNHSGKVYTVDGRASREFGDWFHSGRNAALAVGAEYRHEDFLSKANTAFATLVVSSTGIDPASLSQGTRNVKAAYAELSLPVLKTLDLSLAARFDSYSDFGTTTNPKVTLRYQPLKSVVVRGSFSTGFRAPSLYEINAVSAYTNTGTVDDPVNCPGGTPIPGKSRINNCEAQFQQLFGGNLNLKPEKSKNFTLGVVLEPVQDLSVNIDYWSIKLTDTIAGLSYNTILGDVVTFGQYIHRNPAGDFSTDGTSCPGADCGYIDARTQNLGGTNTNGVDIGVKYRLRLGSAGDVKMALNSTRVGKYEYQDYAGGPWNQNVGIYSGAGPVFRWQHALSASWTLASFTVGGGAHYKSGYIDQDPVNTVNSYATADLYVGWSPIKGLNLTLGVNNLTDREPPYSNQGDVFQANYDPRFSDPTGRKYYARASYEF